MELTLDAMQRCFFHGNYVDLAKIADEFQLRTRWSLSDIANSIGTSTTTLGKYILKGRING